MFVGIMLLLAIRPPEGAQKGQAVVPLTVERAWLEPADDVTGIPARLKVTVKSRDQRSIAAWGLWVETRVPGGAPSRRNFLVDTIETEPAQRRDAIPPNGTVTTVTLLTYPAPYNDIDVIATPAFAVFADDTAIGEEAQIQAVFQLRGLHQRFWHFVSDRLSEITAKGIPPDAAVALILADLDSTADAQLRNSGPAVYLRRELSDSYLVAAKRTRADALTLLSRHAADRMADVDAHASRRY